MAVETPVPDEAPILAPEPVAEPVAVEPVVEPVEAPVEAEPEPVAEPAPEPVVEPEAPNEELKPDTEAVPEAAAPIYTDFKLPEGVAAEPEQITAFTEVLGKHGLTQEAGQELMDLHAASLQQIATTMSQRQHDAWADTRKGWVQEFDKQSGNRRDTILGDAKYAITETIKDKAEREKVWEVLGFTGAGDHPAVINLFAKLGKRLRERSAPAQGLPAKAQPTNPADRRYGQAAKR